MKNVILKIREIVIDERLYPRKGVNESIVQEYARDMKRGDKFPDIDIGLYEKKYYLIDGRHRLGAYEIYLPSEKQYVQCDVKTNFPDFTSMLLAAVRSNIKHGLRLTESDKLKVAYQLKDMKCDIEDIGKLVGIDTEKFESLVVHKASSIIFRSKAMKGEVPSRITEPVKKGREITKIVDDKEVKEMEEKNQDIFQEHQLKDIYDYFKKAKFNTKNKKIKILLLKIKTSIKLR